MSFLDNLKKAPPATKRRYSFLVSLAITSVIGGLWVASLPSRFAETDVLTETKQREESNPIFSKLLDDVKGQAAEVYDGFVQNFATTTVPAEEGDSVDISNAMIEVGEGVGTETMEKTMTFPTEPATTAAKVPEPTRKQTPILIATTTSQKSE